MKITRKYIVAFIAVSVLATSLAGCKSKEEEQKEKADAQLQQWFKNGADFKHSEPKKSVF